MLDDVDPDMITMNNVFGHLVKEISITRYGHNRQQHFSPMKFTTTLTQC